jgi:sugar-specific transcriptional regulator TrmB
MLKNKLIQFGLSDKEADVYLALLGTGTTLVSDIAKVAKLNRSTTYVLLDSLKEKGLVSITEEGKVRNYTAAPPERITHLLEESLSKYTDLIEIAQSIVPELNKLHKKEKGAGISNKPKVHLYDGLQGIKSAYEDMLETGDDIRTYASMEDVHALLPEYFPKFYKRRAQKGIAMRVIFPDMKLAKKRSIDSKVKSQETRIAPKEMSSFSPEINIYGNKIAFVSAREKFGLVIESLELSQALKTIFELTWLAGRKLGTTGA